MSFEQAERKFDKPELILIQGDNRDEGDSNGAGKSTIWDAVSWAIFGETVRGIKNDDVINRQAGADCRVTVELVADGKPYTIVRHRKHSGKDANNSLLGNRLQVEQKIAKTLSKTVELGSIDATQKWLLGEIGADFELFRCTVLFAQEETFNFVSATDKKQKEILSKVKRLDFEKSLKSVRNEIKALGEEIQTIDTKLAVLKSHQRAGMPDFEEELRAWEVARSKRVEEKLEEIKEHKREQEEFQSKVVDTTKAEEIIAKITKLNNEKKEERRSLRDKRDLLQRKIGYFRGKMKEIKDLGGKEQCPVCEQKVSKNSINKHLSEIEVGLKEHEGIEREINARMETIDNEVEELSEKEKRCFAKLKENMTNASSVGLKKAHIKKAIDELDRIKAEENPFAKKIEEAKEKMAKIEAKIVEIEGRRTELEQDLPYLNFWENGFSDRGMKSFVFDSICSVLTAKANHYLGIMSDGFLAVTFDTQTKLKSGETREKFECSVLADGQKVPFEAYSGGEKTRISLAVDMALASLMMDTYGAGEFNVVVFDEQDTFLDAQGRDFYLKLLKERAKTQTVFVVSHDSELKSRFETVWTVVKENGVSRFE